MELDEFTQKMKDELIAQKQGILNQLIANSDDFKALVDDKDAKDEIDVAADAVDRKMLEALGAKDLNRMKMIDNALARIDQGKYGLCLKCGKHIPQERLEAIPYAFLCISCQSASEKRH